MLRQILATASVISIVAVGSAQAGHETNADYDVTGELAAFGGYQWLNIDESPDFEGAVFGGAGRANLSFGNHWNAELEFLGESERFDFEPTTAFSDISVLPHVYWRDPSQYAAGVFAGYTHSGLFGFNFDTFTIGPEVQWYLQNTTLYGQGGYQHADTRGFSADMWFFRAEGRHYFTSHLMASVEGGYRGIDGDFGFEADHFFWGATGEYLLDSLPVSFFATVEGDHVDTNLTFDFNTIAIKAGIKVLFGFDNLRDRDLKGPTMNFRHLPMITFFED